jgi:hypothetical protein
MKLTSIAALAATAVFASTLVGAAGNEGPRLSVDPTRHPRAAEAQDLVRKAFFKLQETTQENGADPGGHRAKALGLLIQVNDEIAAGTPGSLPPQ